jgi:hypothetical protein
MNQLSMRELVIRSDCRRAIDIQRRLFALDEWQHMDAYERGIYVGRCMMAQDVLDRLNPEEVRDEVQL